MRGTNSARSAIAAVRLKDAEMEMTARFIVMADYEFPNTPFGSRRALKVICIGAGATGIDFVKQVTTQLKDVEIVVYEKNSDVGGTWLENRYPGCACDIPIHIYCFTWALNPEWSRWYVLDERD